MIVELGSQVGGISRTSDYGGNRMDIGGHRFFSKSDWVMDWWQEILPLAGRSDDGERMRLAYQSAIATRRRRGTGPTARTRDRRDAGAPALSRIYFLRRFFDYPIRLNVRHARASSGSSRIGADRR